MKKVVLRTLLALICLGMSYVYAQNVSTPERKYYYLNHYEGKIIELPFPLDSINNVIIPEINAEKAALAPNFPVYGQMTDQEKKDAFFNWLNQYPAEFQSYYSYIATYIRTNSNSH